MEAQSVVVIQDACKEVYPRVFDWAINRLSLKQGDKLTLVAILHQLITPMGYKSSVDSSSMIGANKKIIETQIAWKKEEYRNNEELVKIIKQYESKQVEFNIEVVAGPSPKEVALTKAISLKATWVVLDRQKKKDVDFFLQMLSCGISKLISKNQIEHLRGMPKFPTDIQRTQDVESINSEDNPFGREVSPWDYDQQSLPTENIQNSPNNQTTSQTKPGENGQKNLISSVCSICESRCLNTRRQTNFTYKELQAATDGFSIKNSLNEGEYGPTFSGQLECKLKIVVKQRHITGLQKQRVLKSEIQLLINARHANVVKLLGSCIEDSQLLIVYEYVCNGSLDQYLSRENHRPLTWSERLKVAIGASRGLKYLHDNKIIHGSIKPSNILLTHEFEALLGDYGFEKETRELKNCCKDRNVGDCGYTAPECLRSGKLSTETDVYSFGVVLLELISGHRITDNMSREENLVEWARPLLKRRNYRRLVDPIICSSCDEQQLCSLVQVTEKCLRKNPKERPTMNRVVSELPYLVDDQENNVIKDSRAGRSNSTCSLSVVTSSRSDVESPADVIISQGNEVPAVDESTENTQERENSINSVRTDKERKLSHQERENHLTCAVSIKETKGTKSLSTEIYKKSERSIFYGGARSFFLGDTAEYIADEQFFI